MTAPEMTGINAHLVPSTTDARWVKKFFRLSRLFGMIFRPFVDLHDEVSRDLLEPSVIAANHRSLLDVMVGLYTFYRHDIPARILIADRYFQPRLTGAALRYAGCVAVPKGDNEAALQFAIAELQAGYTVVIMPEGKLIKPEDRPDGMGELRSGVSVIGAGSGVPVIAIGVLGTDLVWPRGGWPKFNPLKRKVVKVRDAEPLLFSGDDHPANVAELRQIFVDLLAKMDLAAPALLPKR